MATAVEKLAKAVENLASDCRDGARRKRMLVVGESLCTPETVAALAGWMDIEVETAENDRIAAILATLSLIEDRPYEAVLIDVEMPEAFELEAARWLRRHGWFGPIVGTGNDADGEARRLSLESGCSAFIDKPLTPEKVKAAYATPEGQDVDASPPAAPRSDTPEHEKPMREMPRCKTSGDDAALAPRSRVLVADDALCMQAIIGTFLQGMELDADMADNGKIACDLAVKSLADGHPYDVIIMDIQMPKLNGKQAAKWLRENNWKGPIVALSSHATPKDHAAFLAAGCNDCLTKPLTRESLCGALSRYVQC